GANALGAMLGVRLCAARARPRIAAGLMIAALTAASEWQGFSRIIDAVPVLRALDRWGRAPS
ncbi:MAG: hypothetical protein M3140_12305, partial [Actinomycetota bacterium]|nr:hypothetical protein [Actinomycetota bacterium]